MGVEKVDLDEAVFALIEGVEHCDHVNRQIRVGLRGVEEAYVERVTVHRTSIA